MLHSRRGTFVPLSIAILVLVSLFLFAWRFGENGPGFEGSASNSAAARELLEQGEFISTMRPPLYPALLAGIMQISGAHWESIAAAFQCGISLITVALLAYAMAVRGAGKTGIALLVFLFATNLLYQIEVTAQRDTVFFTLFLTIFLYTTSDITSRPLSRVILTAIVVGLACLLRASAIVLVPALVFIALYSAVGSELVSRAKLVAVALVTYIAVMLPWQIDLSRRSGSIEFSPATSSGQNLFKGNNENFFNLWPEVDVDALDVPIKQGLNGVPFTSKAADDLMKQEAYSYIKENPLRFIWGTAIKFIGFFNPIPTPLGSAAVNVNAEGIELNQYNPRHPLTVLVSTLHYLIVGMLWVAFPYLVQSGTLRKEWQLSVFIVLEFALLHSVFFPESRYRLPLEILWLPFSVFSLLALVQKFAARGAQSLGMYPALTRHSLVQWREARGVDRSSSLVRHSAPVMFNATAESRKLGNE